MRLAVSVALLSLLCFHAVQAQCPKTLTKTKNLLTTLLNDKAVNAIVRELALYMKNDLPLVQAIDKEYQCSEAGRTDCLMNKIQSHIMTGVNPIQGLQLLATMSQAMNCFDDTGMTIDQVMNRLKTPLLNHFKPVYSKMRQKCSKMMGNKKNDNQINNQMCIIMNNAFVKKFVQQVINKSRNNLKNPAVWACVERYAPTIMTRAGNYNW